MHLLIVESDRMVQRFLRAQATTTIQVEFVDNLSALVERVSERIRFNGMHLPHGLVLDSQSCAKEMTYLDGPIAAHTNLFRFAWKEEFSLLNRIRIPTVVYSSSDRWQLQAQQLGQLVDGYVEKPFELVDLVSAVDRVVNGLHVSANNSFESEACSNGVLPTHHYPMLRP